MKREALTVVVTLLFALSLAGTSPAPGTKRRSDAGAGSLPSASGSSGELRSTPKSLPNTSDWHRFSSPTAKISARTPPDAKLTCTDQNGITVCVLMRGGRLLGTFSAGGRSAAEMMATLKSSPRGGQILYETTNALVIHREDPTFGSFCEYVVQAARGLRSVFALTEGVDPSTFQSIALRDEECLEVVAFSTTMTAAP